MAVYSLARYPLPVSLTDGRAATLRPLNQSDYAKLCAFFLRIPERERFQLKDDIASSTIVKHWTDHLDYDRALPLLAEEDGKIVAEAVLIRHRGGWFAQAAEVRLLVDPDYRASGLGTTLLRELLDIAADADLDQVVFQLIDDVQGEAMHEVAALGAVQVGCIEGLARDEQNHPHDVRFYTMPLGKWWEWARA